MKKNSDGVIEHGSRKPVFQLCIEDFCDYYSDDSEIFDESEMEIIGFEND